MQTHGTVGEISNTNQKTPKSDISSSPFDQVDAAFSVLQTLEADYLQDHDIHLDKKIMLEGLRKWYNPQREAYVKQSIENDKKDLHANGEPDEPPLVFNFLARINRKTTVNEIFGWTAAFGKLLGQKALIASNVYKRYSPEQLSGFEADNSSQFIFRLVPSKWQKDQRLYATVSEQNEVVKELQAKNAFVGYPDVVDDIFNWFVLHRKGDRFNDDWTAYRTLMRHSNMAIKVQDEVPSSVINGHTLTNNSPQPLLDSSGVLAVDVARLVIR